MAPAPGAEEILSRACEHGEMGACAALGTALAKDPATRAEAIPLLERACAGGARLGCTSLGEHFLPYDANRGEVLLELACAAFEARACFLLGERHPSRQRYFSQACLAGDLQGCVALADALADSVHAHALYDTACQRGVLPGCLGRARLVLQERIPPEGTMELQATCRSWGGLACVVLADAYLADADLAPATDAAREALARGCQTGAALACARWGLAQYYGWGARAPRKEALATLASACELGAVPACDRISVPDLLASGCIDDRECDLALEAWEGGDRGLRELMRATGRGLARTCGEACIPRERLAPAPARPRALHEAACAASPVACAALDRQRAVAVAEARCQQGSLAHCIAVAEELGAPGDDTVDYALSRACDLGHGASCTRLGEWHVRQDRRKRGTRLLRRACELDDNRACALLEELRITP